MPAVAGVLLVNFLLVGLPLLMMSLDVRHAPHIILFMLASGVLCAAEFVQASDRPERFTSFERYQCAALAGGAILLILQWSALTETGLTHRPHSSTGMVSGLVTFTAGCLLRAGAIRQLNAGFRSQSSTTSLATTGVFATCRHPSETGLILTSMGLPIILGAWWTLALFLPPTIAVAVYRTQAEERSLRSTFGAEHDRYRQAVGRWIPWFATVTEPGR